MIGRLVLTPQGPGIVVRERFVRQFGLRHAQAQVMVALDGHTAWFYADKVKELAKR